MDKSGGLVFPVGPNDIQDGLTLRELFAGLAMQGMVTYAATQREVDEVKARSGMPYSQFIVKSAVHYADSLIAELNKET